VNVNVIDLQHVTKRYRSGAGIGDITLGVRAGEVFGFLGPNGAGKSTTIRLIMDLIRPDAGSIRVLGLDVRHQGPEVRRRVGYLPGELSLYEHLTGLEVLDHLRCLRGEPPGRSIEELAERFVLDARRPIRELSRGNKQKVGLVQALMGSPEVVILDEPTSGLDPLIQREVRTVMRELADEGCAVLLSSHVLSEVDEVADRVAIIREGSLVATESVVALRERAVRHLHVRTAAALPTEVLASIDGVEVLASSGGTSTTLTVTGSMDPVIKALARYEVLDLEAGEPDLEEIFLGFYEERADETDDAA
jgi:ABC-2 type transport system ATP-binding protein